MLRVRRFDSSRDYDDVQSWWISHGAKFLPKKYLPKVGFIGEKDDGLNIKKLASCFLYKDSLAQFGFLTWVCINPESEKEDRNQAIELVIQSCLDESKKVGVDVIFTCTSHIQLQERFKTFNFRPTNQNSQEFIYSFIGD